MKTWTAIVGTRDRSWGIRPIGARDAQELAPPQPGQFFWIWSPSNFPDGSFFFHTNDEASGEPWNRRAVWVRDGANAETHTEIKDSEHHHRLEERHAARQGRGGAPEGFQRRARKIVFEPRYEFYMLGLGYGHPKWGHGAHHGELVVEREDLKLSEIDPRLPQHLHVQALCKVTYKGPDGSQQVGRGVLEQLALGPHEPSGFKQMLDYAP